MRTLIKRAAMFALLLGVIAAFTAPALAAAPSNDTFAGAKRVTLGFSQTLDTSEATSDATDAQALASCGAPTVAASVWYALEGDGSRVLIDLRGTDYVPGLAVVTGSPGNFTLVTCDAYYAAFDSVPGTTYYVVAFDSQVDGGGNGGSLAIAFTKSVQPTLTFSVDEKGVLDKSSGNATISGSYTCTVGAYFSIFVAATRGKVMGQGEFQGTCDGSAQRWTVVVDPERGKFSKGKLKTTSFGTASTVDQGYGYEIKQKVDLKDKRK